MRNFLLGILLGATFLVLEGLSARANYDGPKSPEISAWFKSVHSAKGVPCCDVADGHFTDWSLKDGHFIVPIGGEWIVVPEEAVIMDATNPTGESVVWYSQFGGKTYIRCFVPAIGA